MLRRVEQGLLVTLLVILIGGHWAILQSAAWAGMLVKYSQEETLVQAWTKTFNGENPCHLCKAVKEGKKAERQQELVKLDLKFEFSFIAETDWLFPSDQSRLFPSVSDRAEARALAPLLPPPIAA